MQCKCKLYVLVASSSKSCDLCENVKLPNLNRHYVTSGLINLSLPSPSPIPLIPSSVNPCRLRCENVVMMLWRRRRHLKHTTGQSKVKWSVREVIGQGGFNDGIMLPLTHGLISHHPLSIPAHYHLIDMSFLNLSKSRPNKHTDRALWNSSWENDLKIWQTFEHTPPKLYIQDPRIHAYGTKTESVLLQALGHIESDIIRLQSDLHHKAVIRLATGNFAEEWTTLSTSSRETHLLEALYKASTTGPDMEGCRKWCPELTLQAFAQDGRRYVDFLESFVGSATATVEEKKVVTFFPNPVVDKIFAMTKDLQGSAFALKMRLDRAFFMTMFLWRTLLAFVRAQVYFTPFLQRFIDP